MSTAVEKIKQTTISMRSPSDEASGPELAIATLVQGLSNPAVDGWLREQENAGTLDPFLVALAGWLLSHTSDENDVQAIVPLPRNRIIGETGELPHGVVLSRVRQAQAIALAPPALDLAAIASEDEDEDSDDRSISQVTQDEADSIDAAEQAAFAAPEAWETDLE